MHGVEATARENGAALAALPADGVAVFPGDDPYTGLWRERAGTRARLEFGLDARCAVHADARAAPAGFALRLPGATLDVRLAIDGRAQRAQRAGGGRLLPRDRRAACRDRPTGWPLSAGRAAGCAAWHGRRRCA